MNFISIETFFFSLYIYLNFYSLFAYRSFIGAPHLLFYPSMMLCKQHFVKYVPFEHCIYILNSLNISIVEAVLLLYVCIHKYKQRPYRK